MAEDVTRLLKQVTELWLKQLELCRVRKNKDFGDAAREVMSYVGKRYNHLNFQQVINGVPQNLANQPIYLTTMNYTQAFVDILTPYVFAKVPNRLATPLVPQLPPDLKSKFPALDNSQIGALDQDKLVSNLIQRVLSWTPNVYGLKREGRMAVQESLAKGMSCAVLQMTDGPTGPIPANFADSIDNWFIDPDTVQRRDAGYVCRIVTMPTYKIAEMWGEKLEDLRATGKSSLMEASRLAMGVESTSATSGYPNTADIGVYFEFWSRVGLGQNLIGASDEIKKPGPIRATLDALGTDIHFAVMPGLDHPLGMSKDKIDAAATNGPDELTATLRAMLEWPIKTYGNTNDPWPVTFLEYKPNIDNPWAKPPLESALPLQEFMDLIYQGLMRHAKVASRIFIVTAADAEPVVQETFMKGLHLEMIKLNQSVDSKSLDQLVGYLKCPEINKDLFTILALCDKAFRELTGMDPSIFGGIPRSQDRSAEATKSRTAGISRRPDDYADAVEEWLTQCAVKEMIALRTLTEASTVAPVFREKITDLQGQPVLDTSGYQPGQLIYGPYTQLWIELVHTDDEYLAASQCQVTIAAGSGRRHNRQLEQESAQQMYTMLGQQLYAIAEGSQFTNFEPFIALVQMVGEAYENTKVGTIIDKLREFQEQQRQTMAAQQTQPATGQPGEGGGAAKTGAEKVPGGGVLEKRWQAAAGGPRSISLGVPPGQI